MAYIGRDTDKISNIEKLDTITFDGSSSYTLQKNSVNFTPNSANSLQVSIDGVVQAGNFTVSGSTIDFGVAIPATSTNDFIFHYGTGLITTPADGTVTTAKLADSSVSLAKLTATGTKDSTTFLRGDNTFAEAGGGITEADQWRLTANIAGVSGSSDITTNLSQVSGAVVGTGMSQSSGIFTFPSTGVYLVFVRLYFSFIENNDNTFISVNLTTDNSSYSRIDRLGHSQRGASAADGTTSVGYTFVDVTDTSNVKIKFTAESQSGGTTFAGSSSENQTNFSFIRLGDT